MSEWTKVPRPLWRLPRNSLLDPGQLGARLKPGSDALANPVVFVRRQARWSSGRPGGRGTPQAHSEAGPPARVGRPPPEVPLGLGVGGATGLGRHDHPCSPTNRRASHAGTRRGGLARSQRPGPAATRPPAPARRRRCCRRPSCRSRSGRPQPLRRPRRRVDERRHPRALADDGEPAAPDALELDAALAERGARAVEGPVPLDDALDALGPEDGSLQVSHGLHGPPQGGGGSGSKGPARS